MSKLIVGIDNGLTGGIVAIDGDTGAIKYKKNIPLIKVKKGKSLRSEFDLQSIRIIARDFGRIHLARKVDSVSGILVVIEKGMPLAAKFHGTPPVNFSLGYSFAMWRTFLVAFKVPYVIVSARRWQNLMLKSGVGGTTKQRSIAKAQQLHPNEDWRRTQRSKKPHDGFTDAFWLAEYGRKYEA